MESATELHNFLSPFKMAGQLLPQHPGHLMDSTSLLACYIKTFTDVIKHTLSTFITQGETDNAVVLSLFLTTVSSLRLVKLNNKRICYVIMLLRVSVNW